MKKFFKLEQRKTNVKTEILAGITTFLAMSYILIVNPLTLGEAGMPVDAVFTATVLAAVIGSLIMALYVNYPVGLAPGMGLNAFFTYTVVLTMGYTWQEALFAVFVAGLLFMLISVTGWREKIINSIPKSLKYATTTGIGFFIAFLGLQSSGIVVNSDATLVSFGDLSNPSVYLTLLGLVIMLYFQTKRNNFGIILTMVIITVLGYALSAVGIETGAMVPETLVASPPSITPIFGQLFSGVDIPSLLTDFSFWTIIFSFLFVDFFDTTGTLIATGAEAELFDENGDLIDAQKAMLCAATTTTAGAVLGTSPITPYIESLSGIETGGRTGLTSLVVAILFFLSLFFAPVFTSVAPYVTAPALIMVGVLMASNSAKIDYEDFACSASGFITIIMMIVTYSIAQGIALGFLTYTLIRVFQGKAKETSLILFVLDIVFIFYFLSL